MLRYFCFNFIAHRYCTDGDSRHVISSVADDIMLQSTSFPSKNRIIKAINEAFQNLDDITVTHKFEFDNYNDFRSYIGDEFINGNVGTEQQPETNVESFMDKTITRNLKLPSRIINALMNAGVKYLGQLYFMTDDDLLSISVIGMKSVREIQEQFNEVLRANRLGINTDWVMSEEQKRLASDFSSYRIGHPNY